MKPLEVEIHEDDWDEFDWLIEQGITVVPSTLGINYTRVRISDPAVITYFHLKYPWINWLDVV